MGLLAVTLIGIGVMLSARIDDRRKGLRMGPLVRGWLLRNVLTVLGWLAAAAAIAAVLLGARRPPQCRTRRERAADR